MSTASHHRTSPATAEQFQVLVLDENEALINEITRLVTAERPALVQLARNRAELDAALSAAPPDVVFGRLGRGTVNAQDTFAIVRARAPDTPVILIAERIDEAAALDALRHGATDLVPPDDPVALASAVQRAIDSADRRRERETAEAELHESHEQLRALTAYLQYVREEERTRIAREIHDELGQMLTNLKIELSWLAGRLPKNRRLLRERARLMLGHIDALVHTIRQIVTELRPGILDDLGLVAALEWQAGEFQRRTGLRCIFESHVGDDRRWDDDVTTAMFRIMQEALTNVLRHAQATLVTVRLTQDAERLVLEIADNGRGITEGEAGNTRSIGLLGMRERAALLGGEISIHGAPGRGTTVVIRLPIPQGNQPHEHENSADRRSRDRAPRSETDPRSGISDGGIR